MTGENTTYVVNRTEKANSIQYRYAGTGTDSKVYYEDAEDLVEQLNALADKQEKIATAIKRIREAHKE